MPQLQFWSDKNNMASGATQTSNAASNFFLLFADDLVKMQIAF